MRIHDLSQQRPTQTRGCVFSCACASVCTHTRASVQIQGIHPSIHPSYLLDPIEALRFPDQQHACAAGTGRRCCDTLVSLSVGNVRLFVLAQGSVFPPTHLFPTKLKLVHELPIGRCRFYYYTFDLSKKIAAVFCFFWFCPESTVCKATSPSLFCCDWLFIPGSRGTR